MGATPFTGTLIFAVAGGGTFSQAIALDDVTTHNVTFQDGSDNLMLPPAATVLKDCILNWAGTMATAQLEIYANGKTTGEIIQDSASTPVTVQRQMMSGNVGFKPSTRIILRQI